MTDRSAARRAQELYRRTWGAEPTVVATAPGRVNLIGEHVDYNDGVVLPMAIEPQVLAVCRVRNDPLVCLV
ncbi:MAG TPA: galactokinase family protein, partial [Gemmatimonadales bacterium]|nr:galactokinase family protein [Gemmatimonadales bacterium]